MVGTTKLVNLANNIITNNAQALDTMRNATMNLQTNVTELTQQVTAIAASLTQILARLPPAEL